MTNRELLELAAKAISISLMWFGDEICLRMPDEIVWNPLDDDGDALRLAVKLGLDVWRSKFPSGKTYVAAQRIWHSNDSMYYDDGVALDGDPYAATRKSIVRAAAEIGKAMK